MAFYFVNKLREIHILGMFSIDESYVHFVYLNLKIRQWSAGDFKTTSLEAN